MTEFEIRVALADPEFAKLVKRWAELPMDHESFATLDRKLRKKIGIDVMRCYLVFIKNKTDWKLVGWP